MKAKYFVHIIFQALIYVLTYTNPAKPKAVLAYQCLSFFLINFFFLKKRKHNQESFKNEIKKK